MYISFVCIYIYIHYNIISIYISPSKEAIYNPNKGAGEYNFIYPRKLWTKQNFFQANCAKLCYTHWKNAKSKIIGNSA